MASPIATGTDELVFDRALPQHGGAYQLIASNSFGSVTSAWPRSPSAGWPPGATARASPMRPLTWAACSAWPPAISTRWPSNPTAPSPPGAPPLNGATNVPPGLSNVVAVSGGNYFSVALKSDGTVTAWGLGTSGQTNVPAGLTNVVAISAGGNHTLALRADGTVAAWGYNTYGQVDCPRRPEQRRRHRRRFGPQPGVEERRHHRWLGPLWQDPQLHQRGGHLRRLRPEPPAAGGWHRAGLEHHGKDPLVARGIDEHRGHQRRRRLAGILRTASPCGPTARWWPGATTTTGS